jgi:hypothetical protein
MNMTDKEKTDALIELIKIRVDKYKQTRELEFKVNLALWTLIVLIGQYYKTKVGDINSSDLLVYGLVNVRTDGNTILCATLNEGKSKWEIKKFNSRF